MCFSLHKFHVFYINKDTSMVLKCSTLKNLHLSPICADQSLISQSHSLGLLKGSLCITSTEFLSLILVVIIWQKVATFTNLHSSHFVIHFRKKSLCLKLPLRFLENQGKMKSWHVLEVFTCLNWKCPRIFLLHPPLHLKILLLEGGSRNLPL